MRNPLLVLSCFVVTALQSFAADYTAELAAVSALGNLTTAPAIYTDDTTPGTAATLAAGDLKSIYFDALDYDGNATRVFAWVGIPSGASAGSPVPGVVLVHGGGGSAFQDWVQKWNDRGYAAISIAVEGQTDVDTDPVTAGNQWATHNMPGPSRNGIYGDSAEPIADQWMYHAAADAILANSLLRSLPEVDANNIGIGGFSWGGVITSTVIGIDNRFAFAMPTYGCGHLFDARNLYGNSLGSNELYKEVWDPMVRIANATMPVLWHSWPQEGHFPMDSLAYTYHAAGGPRTVSLIPNLGHGHKWLTPDPYDFADSVVATTSPWCEQQSVNLTSSTATAVFDSSKTLTAATLVYTTDNDAINTGIDISQTWVEVAADSLVESPAGTWTATATLPAGVTAWFINVAATATVSPNPGTYNYEDTDLTASSDYQEVITALPTPSSLSIAHVLGDYQTTDVINLAYTGATDMEISSFAISGESHAGAFSCLTAAPLTLLNPSPTTTAISIGFNNIIAGLTDGQSATATLTITWDNIDGSTSQSQVPLSATAALIPPATTVVYNSTSEWFSQEVRSADSAIIRNDATVTITHDPELITNGSFETPAGVGGSGFSSYAAGSIAISGWTISGTNAFLIDGFDNFGNASWVAPTVASDGNQFAQLQWNSPEGAATVSQAVTTEVGARYRLSFDYSAMSVGNAALTLSYDVGAGPETVAINTIAHQQLPWVAETHEFVATSTTTTVSFTGDYWAGFYGPSLDNVSLVKIEEPNLITNGGFEAPDIPNSFAAFAAASGSLNGWTIATTSAFVINGYVISSQTAVASEGDQFVQLQGHLPAGAVTLSQTINTVVGKRYRLSFDYGAMDNANRSLELTYDVGSGAQTVNISSAPGQIGWNTEEMEFIATSTTTTVSFTGHFVGGFWGPSLDNVNVEPLPDGAVVDTLTVNDQAAPETATLVIDEADYTLTVSNNIRIGSGTGVGTVNQSNGRVSSVDITVNSSGTGGLSEYNLSGGTLTVSDELRINHSGAFNLTGGTLELAADAGAKVYTGGTLTINGGTLYKDFNGSVNNGSLGNSIEDGLIQVQSGALQIVNGTVATPISLPIKMEISGGNIDLIGQVWPYDEFKIIGDSADIDFGWLGTQAGSHFIFEFGASGVSTVDVISWMALSNAEVTIDGSNYTGGSDTFILFDGSHISSLLDEVNNINITGFDERGLKTSIVQDTVTDHSVSLVVTETAYATWATAAGFTGSDANFTADPDGDGCDNFKEFALNGDPDDASDSPTMPTLEKVTGTLEFTYIRRVNHASEGLTYTVKTSTDLSIPTSSWGSEGLGVEETAPHTNSDYEWVTIPVSVSGADSRFALLEIDMP